MKINRMLQRCGTEQLRESDADGNAADGVQVALHVGAQAGDAALSVNLKQKNGGKLKFVSFLNLTSQSYDYLIYREFFQRRIFFSIRARLPVAL
jgi:molybdate-binding protein